MSSQTDLILGATTMAAIVGAALRHFIPIIFKAEFWSFSKQEKEEVMLSLEKHELLCKPIRERLDDGEIHFKEISDEVRYIRALVVIQAPQEAIKKADEIVGLRSLNAGI